MAGLPFCVVPNAFTVTNDFGDSAAGHPASHLSEFDTVGMTWRTGGGTTHTIVGDFGAAKAIDFMAMLAGNAGPSTTIRLRLGADGGTWPYDSGFMSFISPSITRADGLYGSHFELPSLQTYRYFALDVQNTANFEASALVLGQKVQPANFYSPGWEMGVEDLGDIDIGRYGVVDETPGRIMRSLNFQLGWMSEVDFETKFRPLVEKLGKRRVALWCFDPAATVYRQSRTYFGWLRNQLVASHAANVPAGAVFSQGFDILSMV